MRNQKLRKRVKLLKANGSIKNYYEIAELLEISSKGFYNWLSGYYDFGENKLLELEQIIDDIYIPE